MSLTHQAGEAVPKNITFWDNVEIDAEAGRDVCCVARGGGGFQELVSETKRDYFQKIYFKGTWLFEEEPQEYWHFRRNN